MVVTRSVTAQRTGVRFPPAPHTYILKDVRESQGDVFAKRCSNSSTRWRERDWRGSSVAVGTMSALRVTARTSCPQIRGGEHEQPGGRIEVARLTSRDGFRVGDHDGDVA